MLLLLLWLAVLLLRWLLTVIIFAGHGENAKVERKDGKTRRRKEQKRTYNVNCHSSHRASPKTAFWHARLC